MTIADQLIDINNSKQAIKTSIENKGVTVGSAPLDQYAGLIDTITTGGPVGPITWVRPTHWLAKPTVLSSEQKIAAIIEIKNVPSDEGNNVAFSVIGGAYTVNWGDGNTENFTAGTARHQYSYSAVSNDNITETDTKQVYITITPQSGQNLTTFSLQESAVWDGSVYSGNQSSPFIEIILSLPNSTNLLFGATGSNKSHSLQNIEIVNIKNNTGLNFIDLNSLQNVVIPETYVHGNTTTQLFRYCRSLINAPLFNTSAVTNSSYMFENCLSLRYVPEYNWAAVTNPQYMFSECVSLEELPNLNFSAATNLIRMFQNCRGLKTIESITTTGALTNVEYCFFHCNAITEMPLFNTSNVNSFANTFSYCYSLEKIPEFDFTKAVTINAFYDGLFRGCYSLERLPESIKNLPVGLTRPDGFAADCYSLKYIPDIINTAQWTQLHASIFNVGGLSNLLRLEVLPALNLSGLTTGTGLFSTMNSLIRSKVYGLKFSHSYQNSNLGRIALNEVIENLGIAPSAQTLTISNTPGAVIFPALSRSSTTTSGSTTVNCSNTASFFVGMQVTGTGIDTARAITFQDAGDTVTLAGHGIPNGKRVSFTAITSTTGIAVYTPYYVINATTDTFQLSLTQGGSAIALTTDGSGTMIYQTMVTAINPNVSVTIDVPASASGTNTLVYRNINTQIAVMKRWAVTG